MADTASMLMLRWQAILSGYSFEVVYVKGKLFGNADGMSRLPVEGEGEEEDTSLEIFAVSQIEELPITAKELAAETSNDLLLSQVKKCILNNWKDKLSENLRIFHAKRNELSVEADVILWGHRVIIPTNLKQRILNELHTGHFGATKMKQIARSRFWWPYIDKNIEQMVKSCSFCASQLNDPPKEKHHKWELTTKPWERIHVDFA
ncbi:uncharacterized protein B4U80_04962, partial [Leptotrombidium deliense]